MAGGASRDVAADGAVAVDVHRPAEVGERLRGCAGALEDARRPPEAEHETNNHAGCSFGGDGSSTGAPDATRDYSLTAITVKGRLLSFGCWPTQNSMSLSPTSAAAAQAMLPLAAPSWIEPINQPSDKPAWRAMLTLP